MEWMPVLSKVLEAILIAILPPLVVALVSFLLGLAKRAWAEAREIAPTITDYVELAAQFAVKAAEQAGAADLIEDKKQYALGIAQKWLAEHNLYVDLALIDAAIEQAVGELFPHDKALPTGFIK